MDCKTCTNRTGHPRKFDKKWICLNQPKFKLVDPTKTILKSAFLAGDEVWVSRRRINPEKGALK